MQPRFDRYGIPVTAKPRQLSKTSRRIKATRRGKPQTRYSAELTVSTAHVPNPSWSGTRCQQCNGRIEWSSSGVGYCHV